MLSSKLTVLAGLLSLATAHFHVEYPEWRANSLSTPGASQYTFPCANISETTDLANRTQWPTSGGSLNLTVSHQWALTYVNLGIGTNVSAFNISLVSGFNQTGNGTLCLKETGKAALAAGIQKAGLTTEKLDGLQASLQIIQVPSTGASLYNCADITFNATAALLSDDQCSNSTGVGGVAIQNAGEATPASTSPGASSSPTSAASRFLPEMGALAIAGLAAWLVL
ncbi:hypothetical protein K504DRAFT_462014 [Pleomassaria siparia CBS 279.74]|uniref:Copper acquisition factor BIM1-like domain-containing protein n=1 Tax=Pleomassaria siparia CBS 279.74 TaxID=1314801 RepID=A0A6G1KLY3_9PLEO|nr:hypothetical protein K504DRAFT_462014 [Pleomassaria siparia CBS 279.74]